MTEGFHAFADFVALLLEGGAALLILIGAIGSFVRILIALARSPKGRMTAELGVWTGFGVWLMLALEFALGSDIIRSAISPTWTDIGQLAAIAGIRVFLNYFLERDVDKGAASTMG